MQKKCCSFYWIKYCYLFLTIILCSASAFGQQKMGGTVSDQNGGGLPGVSVNLAGSATGTVTDENGDFFIKINDSNDTLVFTSLGFLSKTIPLNGRKHIDVQLVEDLESLDEVVVVGYGTNTKRDLTGSVSQISGEELENRPVLRVDQMLQGQAAGVNVRSTSGDPGSGTTIRIRGARSINATNEPLYVIDGLIGTGDLNTINPEDVASIEILKDASATAIYGSRGSNGVILITTKRGKSGQDNISVSLNSGFSTLPNAPELLNAREFALFIKDAREEAITDPELLAKDQQYKYVNSLDLNAIGNGTDWIDKATHTAPFTNVNISASGGTEKLRYYMSGNYADQDGVALNSGFKRYQARLNIDKEFNKFVKFGASLNISRTELKYGQVAWGANSQWKRSVLMLAPTIPVYQEDGSYSNFNPFAYSGGGTFDSPVAMTDLIKSNGTRNNLIGNIYTEISPVKELSFRSMFGYQLNYSRNDRYTPTNMPTKIAAGNKRGYATSSISNNDYLLWENTFSYTKYLGGHNFNALAGATYQNDSEQGLNGSGNGFLNDIYEWNNLGAVEQDQKGVGSSYTKNTIVSFLGRVNYNFASKYYLTLTGRYDGASNFAASKKWGFFPSAAIKWRLSEEKFVKNLNFFDNIALKFSYGLSGNQGISNYSSLPSLSTASNGYIFGDEPNLAYYAGRLANNNLTWETSKQADIGLEFAILKSRLSVVANYYDTRTENLLLNIRIPTQTGFSSRLVNLGETMTKGFELAINSKNIESNNFSWETRLALSTNKQEILDLGPLVKVAADNNNYGGTTNYYEVGVPLGALYGAYYAGTWKSEEEINAELSKPEGSREFVSTSNNYIPGRMKYKDLNKNGVLDEEDRPYLGSPNPELFGGIGNTFRYKNFDLDIYFNGNYGGKMFNNAMFFMATGANDGVYTNQYAIMKDRWHPERNPDSDIPGPNSRDNIPSTYLLQDASFLRLSSLRLGYNFTLKGANNWMKSAYIYFSGSNLWLLTKYNNFDPEVNKSGTSSTVRGKDDGVYPNSRVYTMGVNINF